MITVFFETPLCSDICRRSKLSFHVLNRHCGGLDFLIKNLKFYSGQGQGQVQVQHDFQAQPGFEHGEIQVLSGYLTF